MEFSPNPTQQLEQPVKITKLILSEVQGYKDQFIRSFEVNAGHEQIERLENVVDKSRSLGTKNIKPIDIANSVPDIMLPSAVPVGKVDIPYGWGEKRYRFFMEVIEPNPTGYGENVVILQGYTEYPGVILDKDLVDDRMRFYVNSLYKLHRAFDPNTGTLIARVLLQLSILHLPNGGLEINDLTHQHYPGMLPNQNHAVAIRPEDLLVTINAQYSMDIPKTNIVPQGTLIQPVDTDKTLSLPAYHISKTITGVLNAREISEQTYSDADILDNSISFVRSDNRFKSKFMGIISTMYGMRETNTFTFADLKKIDPNVDRIKEIYARGPGVVTSQQPIMDSEDLYLSNIENRLATMLVESLSSLLSENLLSSITLTFTNETGQFDTRVFGAETFVDGIITSEFAEKVRIKFESMVAPVLTQGNQMLVNVIVNANILGDTIVDISVNNNPNVVFRIPTFADSTFSPLIADKATFDNVADQYRNLIDIVTI